MKNKKSTTEGDSLEEKNGDWRFYLPKTGPAVTTFYEPSEWPKKLKENLRYLGLLYKNMPNEKDKK